MTNKLLLAAIAIGLWANLITTWVKPARADAESSLNDIAYDVNKIAHGSCSNSKIC